MAEIVSLFSSETQVTLYKMQILKNPPEMQCSSGYS